MAKVRADIIKRALAKRHARDSFFTEVKNGPTQFGTELLIMDAVAFKKSWANPCIIGYEIKVSRNDFLGDDKWRGYLNYCNQFSFVCPSGMIEADELPDGVGLVYYNPEKDSLWTKRRAEFRDIEPPLGMMQYLIMRWDKQEHPFFTSKLEYFREFVQHKADNRRLGYLVSVNMQKHIQELEKEVRDLEFADRRDRNKALVQNLKEIIKEHTGVDHVHDYKIIDLVKTAVQTGMTPEVGKSVIAIQRELDNLKELANKEA